jgi:hypothetical protein
MVCLVSALNCSDPQGIVPDLNYSVIADAEALAVRAGKRLGKLERIGLARINSHLGCDALPNLLWQVLKYSSAVGVKTNSIHG